MFEVYLITNRRNGKRYVGATSKGHQERWKRHKQKAASGMRRPLYNAMRKHGAAAFRIESLGTYETWEETCRAEQEKIRDLQTRVEKGNGYNITDGGEGSPGRIVTEAEKQKAAETRAAWTEETRQAVRAAQSQGVRASYQCREPEIEALRRQKISEGRTLHLAQRSEAEAECVNKKISSSVKKFWQVRTPEQQGKSLARSKETIANRSEAEKLRISKQNKTQALQQHANMTSQQRQQRAHRISQAMRNNPRISHPCEIDGVSYLSVAEAARQLGAYPAKLRRRLKLEKWPTYKYLNSGS